MRPGEEVDDVEIGRMSQHPAAQPPQPDHDQLAARDPAMLCGKLLLGRRYRDLQGGLCRPRQPGSDGQRIMRRLHQLHGERKAGLACDHAQPVELHLVIVAAFSPAHVRCELGNTARQVERCTVDQRVEQFGALRQILGQRRRERQAIGNQRKQAGARFEQAEQVDRAGQARDQTFPAHCGSRGIGRIRDRGQQVGADRFEGAECGGAAQRRIPPPGPLAHAFDQFDRDVGRGAGVRHDMRRALGDRYPVLVKQGTEPFGDRAGEILHQRNQRGAAIQSVQPRGRVQRFPRRERMRLLVADHLQPVLDRPQTVVALTQRLRIRRGYPAGRG